MAKAICLRSHCEFVAEHPDIEAAKRIVIKHMNDTHEETHVISACLHDMEAVGDEDREVKLKASNEHGRKGETVTFPQTRLRCKWCGDEELRAKETAEASAADPVTAGAELFDAREELPE